MGRMIMMRERCIHLLLALYDYNINKHIEGLIEKYYLPHKTLCALLHSPTYASIVSRKETSSTQKIQSR